MKSQIDIGKKVIEHLRKIRFIGPFPENVSVLLTNSQNALDEARLIDKTLSRADLAKILKNGHVLVFRDIQDYYEWRIKFKQARKATEMTAG